MDDYFHLKEPCSDSHHFLWMSSTSLKTFLAKEPLQPAGTPIFP